MEVLSNDTQSRQSMQSALKSPIKLNCPPPHTFGSTSDNFYTYPITWKQKHELTSNNIKRDTDVSDETSKNVIITNLKNVGNLHRLKYNPIKIKPHAQQRVTFNQIVLWPRARIICPTTEDTLPDNRIEQFFTHKLEFENVFGISKPNRRRDAVDLSTVNSMRYKYDTDIAFEDPYNPILAELKYLKSNPTCFIVFGKLTTDVSKLGHMIANYWGCEFIDPLVLMKNVYQRMFDEFGVNKLSSAETSESGAYISCTVDNVWPLLEDKLCSDRVASNGYVIAGFPMIPDPEKEASKSVEEQIDYIFNMDMRPDIIIYAMCPDFDAFAMRSLTRFDIRTGYSFNTEIYNRGGHLNDLYKKTGIIPSDLLGDSLLKEYIIDNNVLAKSDPHMYVEYPEDSKDNVISELDVFKNIVLPEIDRQVIQTDPQFVIRVDGRTPIVYQFQVARSRLDILPLQRTCKAYEHILVEEPKDEEDDDDDVEVMEDIDPLIPSEPLNFWESRFSEQVLDSAFRQLSESNCIGPKFRWHLSTWVFRCPVMLAEGLSVRGDPNLAVRFLDNIFFMSSEETKLKFIENPKYYIRPPNPICPCRIFIIGPPRSGKTFVSKVIGTYFGAMILQYDRILEDFLKIKREQHVKTAIEVAKSNRIQEINVQKVEWLTNMLALIKERLIRDPILQMLAVDDDENQDELLVIHQNETFFEPDEISLVKPEDSSTKPRTSSGKSSVSKSIHASKSSGIQVETPLVKPGDSSTKQLISPKIPSASGPINNTNTSDILVKTIGDSSTKEITSPNKTSASEPVNASNTSEVEVLKKSHTSGSSEDLHLKSDWAIRNEFLENGLDFYDDPIKCYEIVFKNTEILSNYVSERFVMKSHNIDDHPDIKMAATIAEFEASQTNINAIEKIELLRSAIEIAEAEIRMTTSRKYGGWVVDNAPTELEVWASLRKNRLLPDEIIDLSHSNPDYNNLEVFSRNHLNIDICKEVQSYAKSKNENWTSTCKVWPIYQKQEQCDESQESDSLHYNNETLQTIFLSIDKSCLTSAISSKKSSDSIREQQIVSKIESSIEEESVTLCNSLDLDIEDHKKLLKEFYDDELIPGELMSSYIPSTSDIGDRADESSNVNPSTVSSEIPLNYLNSQSVHSLSTVRNQEASNPVEFHRYFQSRSESSIFNVSEPMHASNSAVHPNFDMLGKIREFENIRDELKNLYFKETNFIAINYNQNPKELVKCVLNNIKDKYKPSARPFLIGDMSGKTIENNLNYRYPESKKEEDEEDDEDIKVEENLEEDVTNKRDDGTSKVVQNEFKEENRFGDTYIYCPVAFKEKSDLVLGRKQFACVFIGRVYYMSSDKAYRQFMCQPGSYAPLDHPPIIFKPIRLCVTGPIGHNGDHIAKLVATKFGLYYVDILNDFNLRLVHDGKTPIGVANEDPSANKTEDTQKGEVNEDLNENETEIGKTSVAVFEENSSGNKTIPNKVQYGLNEVTSEYIIAVRKYINDCIALPNQYLKQLAAPYLECYPYKEESNLYFRFPRLKDDLNYMLETNMLPVAIIQVQGSNTRVLQSFPPIVGKEWVKNRRKQNEKLFSLDLLRTFCWKMQCTNLFREILITIQMRKPSPETSNLTGDSGITKNSESSTAVSKSMEDEETLKESDKSASSEEENARVFSGNNAKSGKIDNEENSKEYGKRKHIEQQKIKSASILKATPKGLGENKDESKTIDDEKTKESANSIEKQLNYKSKSSLEGTPELSGELTSDLLNYDDRESDLLLKSQDTVKQLKRDIGNPKLHTKVDRQNIIHYGINKSDDVDLVMLRVIDKIVRSTLPRPALLVKNIGSKRKEKNPLLAVWNVMRIEMENVIAMKELAADLNIPWFKCYNSKEQIKQLTGKLETHIKRESHIFETTYEISEEEAHQLLHDGYYFLSKFGFWCPVQIVEKTCPVQMYFKIRVPYNEVYPVVHRRYIYFIVGKPARDKFRSNPLQYTSKDPYALIVPMKIAIIGPPKSGKTSLAMRFAEEYGLEVVSLNKAVSYVTEELSWTELASLLKSKNCNNMCIIHAVEAYLLSPKATTQGWVFDGFPTDKKVLQILKEFSIVPHVIFYLDASMEECQCRAAKGTIRLTYSDLMPHEILPLKYKQWILDKSLAGALDWLDYTWGNVELISAKSAVHLVYEKAKKLAIEAEWSIQRYLKLISRDEPANLNHMCVSPLDWSHRESYFQDYCPPCLTINNSLNRVDFFDRAHLLQYLNYYYWFCPLHFKEYLNNAMHLKKVVENEDEWFYEKPERLQLTERMIKQLGNKVQQNGMCVVCYTEKPWSRDYSLGIGEYAIRIDEKIYLLCGEQCMMRMMFKPRLYKDTKINFQNTIKDVNWYSLNSDFVLNIPEMSYLDQTTSHVLIQGLYKLALARPHIPGVCHEIACFVYLGYYFKCHVRNVSPEVRRLYMDNFRKFKNKYEVVKNMFNWMRFHPNPSQLRLWLSEKVDFGQRWARMHFPTVDEKFPTALSETTSARVIEENMLPDVESSQYTTLETKTNLVASSGLSDFEKMALNQSTSYRRDSSEIALALSFVSDMPQLALTSKTMHDDSDETKPSDFVSPNALLNTYDINGCFRKPSVKPPIWMVRELIRLKSRQDTSRLFLEFAEVSPISLTRDNYFSDKISVFDIICTPMYRIIQKTSLCTLKITGVSFKFDLPPNKINVNEESSMTSVTSSASSTHTLFQTSKQPEGRWSSTTIQDCSTILFVGSDSKIGSLHRTPSEVNLPTSADALGQAIDYEKGTA